MKAVTWRITAIVVTGLIVYSVTGHLELTAAILGLDTLIKLALYYFHERIWYKSKWGLSPR